MEEILKKLSENPDIAKIIIDTDCDEVEILTWGGKRYVSCWRLQSLSEAVKEAHDFFKGNK